MVERLTDIERAAIVAHFSYELEPKTPLPNWNTVAMETVHLRNEVAELRAAFDAAEAKRDELAAVISGIEVSNGITDNGNLWRFWASKCKELAQKVVAAEAEKARAVDAERERCAVIADNAMSGMINGPTDEALYDLAETIAAAIRTG